MAQGRRGRRKRFNGHGKRTKPTPSSTPELTEPSASPPPRAPAWMMEPPLRAADDGSWLILDRFVHLTRRRRLGVVGGDATTSSLAVDCAGRQIRASLRIADPPAVSRVYLHRPDTPQIDGLISDPAAIAAHRNSILFRMSVPFSDPTWWLDTTSFPVEYLVYSCSSSSTSSLAPPPSSLTALPPCLDGGETDPLLDELLQPYRLQQQRIMFNEDMGILCHGDNGEEFTVADLTYRYRQEVDLCLLHHPPPDGIPWRWSVNRLQIPPEMNINLRSWRTDVVVPIGRSLCWVDYYQGMLLIDVVEDHQQLHYIGLPAQALKSHRPYIDPGAPDPFRRICVTVAGIIKLVCIFIEHPPPTDFTIITWTLVDINKGAWIKDVDAIMGADEFFGLCDSAKSCLPWVRPSFPVVSLVDPDVICFLLKEKDHNISWMVEVNMRNKVLLSSALYIKEEEEGPPSEKDRRNTFFGHSFIPTKFTSYLSNDAITSRKLSERMQKDKEEETLQKDKEERAMQRAKERRAMQKAKEERAMQKLISQIEGVRY
ncbi:unnamed protein product [Urochloa decumbens]|uniref:DUF1618 domain-containing protein n=1 Tax=Urochloa decumbens TaxID=240449 RepID=A0ABC9AMF1_9POAL